MGEFEKYYELCLKFLSYRPRSEKELREYLTRKKANLSVIDAITHKLTEQKFLNDEEFAKWFIEQRKNFRKKSDRLIKLELKQKGIDSELFEKAGESLENKKSDEQTARELVERKFGKYKHLPRQEIYQKLGAFLARRGFNWETIKRVIDEAFEKRV